MPRRRSARTGGEAHRRLAVAISSMVASRIFFRPRLSPMRPKTQPPMGRIRKPTAKTANVASNAEPGSLGSNIAAAINGEKTAYAPHSYHSRRLPAVLANSDLVREARLGLASSACAADSGNSVGSMTWGCVT